MNTGIALKSTDLTFRLYRDSDLSGVLSLWTNHSGWGELSAEQWNGWRLTPYGPCLVPIALDSADQIVAMSVLTPCRIWTRDRELRALRLSSPILSSEWRTASLRSPSHPIWQLLLTALETALADDCDLLYGLPAHAWLAGFRLVSRFGLPSVVVNEFPCVAFPVRHAPVDSRGTEDAGLAVRWIDRFTDEHEAIWRSVCQRAPFTASVAREPQWLQWENGRHFILEFRDPVGEQATGYVAVRKGDGLVMDLFVRDFERTSDYLTATARALVEHTEASELGSIKIMKTPYLGRFLRSDDSTPVDFKFAHVYRVLNDTVGEHLLSSDSWYVTPSG